MCLNSHSKNNYILAVDDNPDNLFLIRLALEQQGHTVILIDNGYEALQKIRESPPALILLDVMMPGMDGYQITKVIRRDSTIPFIPILLITAHPDSSLVKGLDSGADEFLRKPIQIDELQARVRSLLRLKKTIDQRESFVSCLTHDLRTPLIAANRMLTLIQQQAFGDTTPETVDAVKQIINSNQHLLEMLNTLLEAYNYEIGQKTLTFVSLDLLEVLDIVIAELEPLAASKNLMITKHSTSQLFKVKGDRLELRRVFTNLIGNAIKYTDQGIIEIIPRFNHTQISIEIKDTGIGISQEDLSMIFNRYHQGQNRRSGKGLGLYLCQQIIEAHQGSLNVISKLGKGTTFSLTLPSDD